MTRPIGTLRLKDNSRKNHAAREEWMRDKRAGRPKQKHVRLADAPNGQGYWEKASE